MEATNARLFWIDKATGEQRELPVSALSFEPVRVAVEPIDFEMPTMQEISFRIHHITRRQRKTWLKLAGLPSGRRAARRRHKRRLK